MVIRGFIVILASYFRNLAFFSPFSRIFTLFLPHPKPPISQQVPLACWWLSGVFPQLLLLLLHGNHHFWFVFFCFFLFFHVKVDAYVLYTFTKRGFGWGKAGEMQEKSKKKKNNNNNNNNIGLFCSFFAVPPSHTYILGHPKQLFFYNISLNASIWHYSKLGYYLARLGWFRKVIRKRGVWGVKPPPKKGVWGQSPPAWK